MSRKIILFGFALLLLISFAAAPPMSFPGGAMPLGETQEQGCANKVFGLVGASNTVDANPDGSSIPSSWKNVNIIKEFCPGATVFLSAKGGTWPGAQQSLVQAVLQNNNLDYVIIDPSANGQPEFSGITAQEYKDAVIKLAKMVKDKDSSIKVIILTNTPLKGAGGGYGTPQTVQKVKAFNNDLLYSKLGRPDLIDYAVNTYSATEDPAGSDSCGKYCSNDHLHFGEAGRKLVIKAIIDTVFGGSAAAAPAQTTPVTPVTTYPSSTENCLDKQRCFELDNVWLQIVKWVNNARKGQVYDSASGWRSYVETRPGVVITPKPVPVSTVPPAQANEIAAANKLYRDILQTLPNQNLAKAMVANAKGESGLSQMTAGDCGAFGEKNSGSSIPINGKGQCCSFGLWQYNICGGLGVSYLQYYDSPSASQEKLSVLQDYQKNVEFMMHHLSNAYPSEILKEKTVDEWVDWFVRTVEKPANQNVEIPKRQGFAQDLEAAGAFSTDFFPSNPSPLTPSTITGNVVYFKDSKLESACNAESLKCVIPQQNVGKIEVQSTSECPVGMVKTGNVCIDQYEAMLVDKDTGVVWSPYCKPGNEINKLRAVSVAGAIPQSTISQVEAQQACQNAGKRLCTVSEWLSSCRGSEGRNYPYGGGKQQGLCNDQLIPKPYEHPTKQALTNSCPLWKENTPVSADGKVYYTQNPWMIQPITNQLPNTLAAAGSFASCVTPEQVYDLVGNLDEWVGGTSSCTAGTCGTFLGGFYARSERSDGSGGCTYATTAHAPSYADYSLGFRCCADSLS